MTPTRYSRPMIWLHWVTAVLLLVLFVAGLAAVRVDFGSPLKQPLFQLHAVAGYVVLVLTLVRLYYKFRTPQPAPPAGMSGLRLLAYKVVHALLYVGIFLMALSGINILQQSGLGLSPFFDPRGLKFDVPPVGLHVNFKWVFAALVLIHIVGVFSYQATKGDVLSRMGLGRE